MGCNDAAPVFHDFIQTDYIIAKLSQAKPQLQLSWLALASLNFT